MASVYRHYPGPDDCVGRVEESGWVCGQRLGPDEYLRRVENNGRIYAHEPGPDRYLGRVPGGPDENVGSVQPNGKAHAALSPQPPAMFLGVLF